MSNFVMGFYRMLKPFLPTRTNDKVLTILNDLVNFLWEKLGRNCKNIQWTSWVYNKFWLIINIKYGRKI